MASGDPDCYEEDKQMIMMMMMMMMVVVMSRWRVVTLTILKKINKRCC